VAGAPTVPEEAEQGGRQGRAAEQHARAGGGRGRGDDADERAGKGGCGGAGVRSFACVSMRTGKRACVCVRVGGEGRGIVGEWCVGRIAGACMLLAVWYGGDRKALGGRARFAYTVALDHVPQEHR